jgi:hypothetical protein
MRTFHVSDRSRRALGMEESTRPVDDLARRSHRQDLPLLDCIDHTDVIGFDALTAEGTQGVWLFAHAR